MRRTIAAAAGLLTLAACAVPPSGDAEVARALRQVDAAAGDGLDDVMMTVADPAEAVAHFRRASAASPDDVGPRRGLAASLVRAGLLSEAVPAWEAVAAHPAATDDDRTSLASAYVRVNDWDRARATLAAVPPTHESFERYRLEAIVADAGGDWARADSFYETAVGLTTTPAGVLNNWGYSHLTRGEPAEAERLFTDALRHDPTLFTAKNNLVLARGAQRDYDLPVVPMTQEERAQLLHTLALTAIKQGDVVTGRGLLEDAVATHPRHFEEATRALEAIAAG